MAIWDFPGYNLLTCTWLPPNNILFQCANSCLVVLYVGDFLSFPSSFMYMLYLRLSLLFCALFFTLWAAWVLCSPDTALWNLAFFIYNLLRLIHLLHTELFPTKVQPRFEKLYKACYKNSGISVETYNKLIEGGTVLAVPQSLPLQKNFYTPDKLVQIVSGKIAIYMVNGKRVKLREGDFINHGNWNFNITSGINTTFVDKYVVLKETTLITWSYPRLTSTLQDTNKRLFSYLLMRNLNILLLRLNDIIESDDINFHMSGDSTITSSDSNSTSSDRSPLPEWTKEKNGRLWTGLNGNGVHPCNLGSSELDRLMEAESGV